MARTGADKKIHRQPGMMPACPPRPIRPFSPKPPPVTLHRVAAPRPDSARAHGDRLYALFYLHDLTPAQVFGEHVARARRHAEALNRSDPPHENDRSPDRRLRVGYVSPLPALP